MLRQLGKKTEELIHSDGGIVCRREADIFQIYCPHRNDYKAFLDKITTGITSAPGIDSRIQLRMGVYSSVDKSLDIPRRFDRAKLAADTVRNSFTRSIGVYDDTLHKAELYHLQLIEAFPRAIDEKQFQVYFQPKYYILKETPILESAECLVRWHHPELGIISPGVFIPLFEENGLIQKLDYYVFREAARQIREWKDLLGYMVPLSVNVSRVDLGDPCIVENLLDILSEFGLGPTDMHLEVTETAYSDDSEQLIGIVKRLRSQGFLIEMDDFGTGYSSLNMLSRLPIDVLKLDMKFTQTALANKKNVEMIGIIVDIANHLGVPVVAEGVETIEQLTALRKLGCDYVQGYYFSAPVPAETFKPILMQSQDNIHDSAKANNGQKEKNPKKKQLSFVKKLSERFSVSVRSASLVFVLAAFILAISLFIEDSMVNYGYRSMENASERYILSQQSATDLGTGSDYLTSEVRSFVITGNLTHLQNYFEEAASTQLRDKAVSNLRTLLDGYDNKALGHLSEALNYSNELMEQEYLAMRLVLDTADYDESSLPEVLRTMELTPEQISLSSEEKRALAMDLVYGDVYMDYKAKIKDNTDLCTQELITESNRERIRLDRNMTWLLRLQSILTIILMTVILIFAVFVNGWIRRPLAHMVEQMKAKKFIDPTGAAELRFVTNTYNTIFEENQRTHEHLTYGNQHDELTGLYNRSAYNLMRTDLDMSHNALLLVDVDKFKSINDTYGHDVGDLVLKRVAEVLTYSFRATDLVFRLGGDEFVVIMNNVDSSMSLVVQRKIEQANVMLQKPTNDLPPTSLSVGVAFGDRKNPEGDIFKDADTALYRMKEKGRCGCYIF